jgi:hypothetical protein
MPPILPHLAPFWPPLCISKGQVISSTYAWYPLFRVKNLKLDLSTTVSYHLHLHTNTIKGTPSTCHTVYFQCADDIERIHSITAVWGENPPCLISPSQHPTIFTHILTWSQRLPLHTLSCIYNLQEILRVYAPYLLFGVKTPYPCLVSPPRHPTIFTHISTQSQGFPLHAPLCIYNVQVILRVYAPYLLFGVKTPHPYLISPPRHPTIFTHISTWFQGLPIHAPLCISNVQVILRAYALYLLFGVKTSHLYLKSPPWHPTCIFTHILTQSQGLPLHAPLHIFNVEGILRAYVSYPLFGVKTLCPAWSPHHGILPSSPTYQHNPRDSLYMPHYTFPVCNSYQAHTLISALWGQNPPPLPSQFNTASYHFHPYIHSIPWTSHTIPTW